MEFYLHATFVPSRHADAQEKTYFHLVRIRKNTRENQ
jgi:hypothetical protein